MTDPDSLFATIAGCLFWIAVVIGVWRWAASLNRSHPGLFNTTVMPVQLPIDHCDHEYQNLPMTELYAHTYDSHFELWNLLGPKDAAPERWRKQHAADHGVRL